MPGRSVRIARIAGIPVGVSPWWLAIVALITWSLGASYFPEQVHGISAGASYALGLVSALLLFASILAHEFGHALVARRHGIEVEEIDLWLLGGVSRMRGEAHDPEDELRYALAGPAVTGLVAVCFGIAAALLPSSTPAVIRALVEYQVFVNALIFVFNLLPAFPLDGGRVLRALLWRRSGDIVRSTGTAAGVGRVFGYVMIGLGVLSFFTSGNATGLWLAVIGFFIVSAAGAQAVGAQVQAALSGVHASELMSTPVVSLPERASAAQAAEYFLRYRYNSFPVVGETGRAVGIVSASQIEAVGQAQRAERSIAEVADLDPDLMVSTQEDVARLLERPAFARVGRAVVVDEAGRPVGLISITDVQRALRASRFADRDASASPHAAAR